MRIVWLSSILILLGTVQSFAQSSDKLKKDQEKLERKIADTKRLLERSQENTQSSVITSYSIHYTKLYDKFPPAIF